jgi:ferredoxin
MTEIRVNEHCVGLSACVDVAPDLFIIVDDHAVPASRSIDADRAGLAQEAAESCPMRAIEIS